MWKDWRIPCWVTVSVRTDSLYKDTLQMTEDKQFREQGLIHMAGSSFMYYFILFHLLFYGTWKCWSHVSLIVINCRVLALSFTLIQCCQLYPCSTVYWCTVFKGHLCQISLAPQKRYSYEAIPKASGKHYALLSVTATVAKLHNGLYSNFFPNVCFFVANKR